uniref:L-dopachrome isomerase n=1 Tax=Candidatus Kentrum sp. FW TaxID=2126338 RepID=A0A450SNT3_9GAMM|nr:MAG: Phenylpyruvate tautomerase PptA, 4-oxalocrotonate tautomerase family [Candidatus Kentron sp. FW]VFJ55535.1 MAG: Phenylpyruvate tautomerase PptA, 4-oxalocrotonate tautomerase family [Candidatus Kentron sp. FW]
MPYLRIQSNVSIDSAKEQSVLTKISTTIAEQLEKPLRYMMAGIDTDCTMMLGGSSDPLAFVELKGLAFPESRTAELSGTLCELLQAELGIPQNRIYIVFSNVPRDMWGWNGGTF